MSFGSLDFEAHNLRPFFSARRSAERFHHFGSLNSRHFPEEPRLGFVAEISELNEVFRGGLKKSSFPSGNGHGRTLHAAGQFCLVDAEPLSQGDDLKYPFRRNCALRFTLHLIFYDTTIWPT